MDSRNSRLSIKRVIHQENVTDLDALFANDELKSFVFISKPCTIGAGGHIIVDFGREICGRVHVFLGGNYTKKGVRIRLGESVAETCAELEEKNAGNHHSLRDAVYPVVPASDLSTSETGFRFARIDAPEEDEIYIVSIFAEQTENGLQKRGYFKCSDDRLNQIYQIAERTISVCVRSDNIWDGIKRDRTFWMGDFYPELLGICLMYGQIPQLQKVLKSIRDFDDSWVNHIPSYSAWWLICLGKYYELTGDEAYVRSLLPYVEKVLKDFAVVIRENGEISYEDSELYMYGGNEFFIDWPTCSTEDSKTGWRYLLIYAMKFTRQMLERFDMPGELADTLLERLQKQKCPSSTFKQVTAWGVLAGEIEPEEARGLLKAGGASGMTTFMSFAIVEALEKIGEGEFALQVIKEYYGAMIDLGATTFWEDFDLEWLKDDPLPLDAMPEEGRNNIHADYGKFCYTGLRHSLCHGWSSGFMDFFYRHILGIVPVGIGYKEIKIEPHLYGMDYVEGEIPCGDGTIYVKHEMNNGKIKTTIRLPEWVACV